ncbi:54S ribosomal protein RML2, mitochondrial [Cyphellophora attinorum]|uniref:Large ribosomal subunit protein uL2m n=1 Tax=Cyphellophora attinorum TaxID=1664694 RepID=A0A0N0NNR0_9EURO|nr:54S ribosomal protein RML2, mitochondrial [Phialophora attinorum]KPI41838.1 54S ribosomal protein RML2, mitochondrial [Phialophora attinorum]
MLQPRIALRACTGCKRGLPLLSRTYATAVEVVAPAQAYNPVISGEKPIPPDRLYPVFGESELQRYKPRTPGIRHLIRTKSEHLWRGRPVYALTIPKKGQSKGGRNHTGRVVVRHRGGGHKRRLRRVDFARDEPGKSIVERIEHDPGRSAHIALIRNLDTDKVSYIVAAEGMRAGDVVQSYRSGLTEDLLNPEGGELDRGLVASRTAHRGNCLPLGLIPVGTPVFNIAPDKNSIGKMCRSAGTYGILLAKGEDEVQKEMLKFIGEQGGSSDASELQLSVFSAEQLARYEKAAKFVTVKLNSGEIRHVDKDAVATIGVASNANHKDEQLGKAGRKRWLGFRPTVRGVAMNAVDHPHGGGRGKGKGNRDPVSPWGIPTKSGYRTKRKGTMNPLIIEGRPRNQGKRRNKK